MMEAIAGAAMDMKSAQLAAEYSIAVTKKVMDTQELAAQELLNMLPATPPVVQKGQLIDTYAWKRRSRKALSFFREKNMAGEENAGRAQIFLKLRVFLPQF